MRHTAKRCTYLYYQCYTDGFCEFGKRQTITCQGNEMATN